MKKKGIKKGKGQLISRQVVPEEPHIPLTAEQEHDLEELEMFHNTLKIRLQEWQLGALMEEYQVSREHHLNMIAKIKGRLRAVEAKIDAIMMGVEHGTDVGFGLKKGCGPGQSTLRPRRRQARIVPVLTEEQQEIEEEQRLHQEIRLSVSRHNREVNGEIHRLNRLFAPILEEYNQQIYTINFFNTPSQIHTLEAPSLILDAERRRDELEPIVRQYSEQLDLLYSQLQDAEETKQD